MHVDIASVSSKGQFTIHRKFRDLLGVSTGSKLIVISDGQNLLLKPIKQAEVKSFRKLIDEAEKLAQKAKTVSTKPRKGGRK